MIVKKKIKSDATRWVVSLRFGKKKEHIRGVLPALVTETEDFEIAKYAFKKLMANVADLRAEYIPKFGPALSVMMVERKARVNAQLLHLIRIDEGKELVDQIQESNPWNDGEDFFITPL